MFILTLSVPDVDICVLGSWRKLKSLSHTSPQVSKTTSQRRFIKLTWTGAHWLNMLKLIGIFKLSQSTGKCSCSHIWMINVSQKIQNAHLQTREKRNSLHRAGFHWHCVAGPARCVVLCQSSDGGGRREGAHLVFCQDKMEAFHFFHYWNKTTVVKVLS